MPSVLRKMRTGVLRLALVTIEDYLDALVVGRRCQFQNDWNGLPAVVQKSRKCNNLYRNFCFVTSFRKKMYRTLRWTACWLPNCKLKHSKKTLGGKKSYWSIACVFVLFSRLLMCTCSCVVCLRMIEYRSSFKHRSSHSWTQQQEEPTRFFLNFAIRLVHKIKTLHSINHIAFSVK